MNRLAEILELKFDTNPWKEYEELYFNGYPSSSDVLFHYDIDSYFKKDIECPFSMIDLYEEDL